ncbi:MAG: immune inhibitor A [Actinomycetota bacterium]|nr:immune inhibitor A [Actinomycetota bacterium]
MPTRRPLVIAAALLALLSGVTGSTALAASDGRQVKVSQRGGGGVALHVPQSVRSSLQLRGARLLSHPRRGRVRLLSHDPTPGELRYWVGLDIVQGALYPKPFAYRGAGRKIEVWVATDLDFQPGDCRNGARTQITDAQVQGLIRAFDRVIYPRESEVFSVPPSRDGTNALVGPPFHPEGAGKRVVVLVDNVRDEAYYDLNDSGALASVIGVYSSAVDGLFDRNMMTIDAFDWLHRTGSRPRHEPSSDRCSNSPAWPNLIEGVFAHEYEHLLEHHEDPDETDWLDEGLAEWARSLTGYADPDRPVTEIGYDRHTQCFLGNLADLDGGPENSLTLWGDGEDVNCDYGAVYSFMEFVRARFGKTLMTALHRGDANGLAGLQEALGRRAKAQAVLHDWAASLAFRKVNWDNAHAYASPGARPNGADYVRLRDASGRYLRARDLHSLAFDGATSIPGRPVEWSVDPSPPNGGPPALYSGAGNHLDRTIVRSLSVPAGGGSLAFQAQWNVEEDPSGGWDFTFVQVSTDGGATYKSVPCTSSRSDASPYARPVMHENLPGYTAYSAGWRSESCDLSAFAGKPVHVAFRHLTDGSVAGDPDDPAATIPPGFWLRNLSLGGAPVADGASLAGWLSPSQVRPTAVNGFTVQLIAYSERGHGRPIRLRIPLNSRHDSFVPGWALRRLLDHRADVVGALVMYDEPTELVTGSAPYALRINGVLQPGG